MRGMFTANTEFQAKCSSMKPVMSGPRATPAPLMPAQMATALARSRRGKTLVMIDSVAGMTMAPATPMTTRAPMSWPAVSAKTAA